MTKTKQTGSWYSTEIKLVLPTAGTHSLRYFEGIWNFSRHLFTPRFHAGPLTMFCGTLVSQQWRQHQFSVPHNYRISSVAQVVEATHCKTVGRGFGVRLGQWYFSLA